MISFTMVVVFLPTLGGQLFVFEDSTDLDVPQRVFIRTTGIILLDTLHCFLFARRRHRRCRRTRR